MAVRGTARVVHSDYTGNATKSCCAVCVQLTMQPNLLLAINFWQNQNELLLHLPTFRCEPPSEVEIKQILLLLLGFCNSITAYNVLVVSVLVSRQLVVGTCIKSWLILRQVKKKGSAVASIVYDAGIPEDRCRHLHLSTTAALPS